MGHTPGEWAITCQRVQEDLRKNTEARNVPFKLADLKDPSQAAIPEDTLDISKVIKSAHFYFWDKDVNCPKAPNVWPRGRNVPVVTYTDTIAAGGPWTHYGHCTVVAGFYWAYAQVLQNQDWKQHVAGFEDLLVNALADYKLVKCPDELPILAINAVEANEESRENDGFFGIRKILLVNFAVKAVQKDKKCTTWTWAAVADWLGKNIKFHDQKAAPSSSTCKDLYQLQKHFLNNTRVHAAIVEAERLWGRETLFDQYSKLTILHQKSQNDDDQAFMVEWLLAEMKTTPPPGLPENPTRQQLQAFGGPICMAQNIRQAVLCVLKPQSAKNVPPTWASHGNFVEQLTKPSTFLTLFPPDGSTPEEIDEAPYPKSLKQATTVLKGIYGGGVNTSLETSKLKEKIKGYLVKAKRRMVPEEILVKMLSEVFEGEWISFQESCRQESGKAPPRSKDLGDQTEGANGGGSGQTPTNPQEGEDLLRKQAVEKARGVFTDPGVVFLTPESWERASLEAMMKGQSHIKDGGFEKRFTAFFLCPI